MARALDEALEDEPVVAERGLGLAAGGRELGREAVGVADRAHALAAAAGGRLDEQRVADPSGGGGERLVRLVGVVVAGRGRDAEAGRELAGCRLVAHRADRVRRRADPADAGLDDRARRTRRSRRGTRSPGGAASAPARRARRDDGVGVEEVDRVRAVRARDDDPDPEPVAGARDPRGDLAPIGDEDGPDPTLGDVDGSAQTRQSRQTRHASDHRRASRGAARWRSSAGRTASTSRAASRPRSG